jgi:type IV secretion system protein VirD4
VARDSFARAPGLWQRFRTRYLISGNLDVFVNLPLTVLQSSPQVARVILGAILNGIYEARGPAGGLVLFCSMKLLVSGTWVFSNRARHLTEVRN